MDGDGQITKEEFVEKGVLAICLYLCICVFVYLYICNVRKVFLLLHIFVFTCVFVLPVFCIRGSSILYLCYLYFVFVLPVFCICVIWIFYLCYLYLNLCYLCLKGWLAIAKLKPLSLLISIF